MNTDKIYCQSSFLTFRRVVDPQKRFSDSSYPRQAEINHDPVYIKDSFELEKALEKQVAEATAGGKAALALSGGIDSAILAHFMPKGSKTYTFRCVIPGIEVTDETPGARKIADKCGLENEIVEIYWEDVEKYAPVLMKSKGAPIHSIEVQIYKAALKAKADGFDTLIFGESADCLFGGLGNILSRDWTFGEFIDRFSFVKPYYALKDFTMITEPFEQYTHDGYVDVHAFLQNVFFPESIASYQNAASCAGISALMPYSNTRMAEPLDYAKVRSGKNKYLIREIFERLYSGFDVPPKLPMPRPTNEWFKDWSGPTRCEFIKNCTDSMTGDQKWLIYCLEKFMDLMDEGKI